MIWVGFSTGMRFGELSALLWSDVDFDKKCIHVRKSQVNGLVGPTKTRGYRTVPLHPLVADVLRRQQRWVETQAIRCVDAGMVFPSNVGSYRHASVLQAPLRRCVQRAGIDKHVSAHTMRRTFNNLARMAAGEIVTRSMTGHATSAMTEHYSHVSIGEKAKALDAAIGGAFGVGAAVDVGLLGITVGVGPNLGPTPTNGVS
jgi:integrase